MLSLYTRIKKFALQLHKRKTMLSDFITFLYYFLSHEVVDAIITIIGVIVGLIMSEIKHHSVFFYALLIIYFFFILMIACAKKYDKEKLIENQILKQALAGANSTLRAWAITMQRCAQSVFNLRSTSKEATKRAVSPINFQSAAFVVCEHLCNNLTKYYENDNIYITIFQKQTTDDVNTCKMIAYSGPCEPSSYGQPYIIPEYTDDLLGSIEFHSYLFSSNKTDIAVLPNRESVKKHFINHKKSLEREELIHQYIGIPIAPANLGVTFLLQVDTNIEGLFGKDKESVEKFAKTAIYPFAQFLHMIYEQSRTIEQLIGR